MCTNTGLFHSSFSASFLAFYTSIPTHHKLSQRMFLLLLYYTWHQYICTRSHCSLTCTDHTHIPTMKAARTNHTKPVVPAVLYEVLIASACYIVQPDHPGPRSKYLRPSNSLEGPRVAKGTADHSSLCQGPVGATYGT